MKIRGLSYNFISTCFTAVMILFLSISCSKMKTPSSKKSIEPVILDDDEEDDDVDDSTVGVEPNIYTNRKGSAFVALREDGSLVAWGDENQIRMSEDIKDQLKSSRVKSVYSTKQGFVVLTEDNKAISFGSVENVVENVSKVVSSEGAFLALKQDGSLVAWGDENYGGVIFEPYQSELNSDVEEIYSTGGGFVAKKGSGQIYSWGNKLFPRDERKILRPENFGNQAIKSVTANDHCFTAITSDEHICYWGQWCMQDYYISQEGPYDYRCSEDSIGNFSKIFTNGLAFSGLKNDGSIISWGHKDYGGKGGEDPSYEFMERVSAQDTPVQSIYSTHKAFTALKGDGSVSIWGTQIASVNSNTSNLSELTNTTNRVESIYPGTSLFVALRSDKSAILWGKQDIFKKIGKTINKVFFHGDNFLFVKKFSPFYICVSDNESSINCFVKKIAKTKIKRVFFNDQGVAILTTKGKILFLEKEDSYSAKEMFSDRAKAVGIVAGSQAFSALLSDGSVVSWGHELYGGLMKSSIQKELNGTVKVLERSN